MEIEKQVVSLELAQRLEKLGVKQESSIFDWHKYPDGHWQIVFSRFSTFEGGYVSAFTVAELGEMLPKWLEAVKTKNYESKLGYWLSISFDETSNKWRYAYANNRANVCLEMWFEDTEADARAKMLIYLIENHLITV